MQATDYGYPAPNLQATSSAYGRQADEFEHPHIVYSAGTFTTKIGPKNKETEFVVRYPKKIWMSFEAVIAEANSDPKRAERILAKLNSTEDNDRKVKARTDFVADDEQAAVLASIEKQVKELHDVRRKAGRPPLTDEEARAKIMANMS